MFLLITSVMPLGIPVAQGFSAPIRVMAVGNSITRGVVGSTDAAGYRNDLYSSLTASGYAIDMVGSQADGIGFDNAHEGHNGWRANQIRDGVSAWLDLNPADIVLLHVGTNDISDEQSVPAIATEINQILNKIDTWEQSPGNNEIWVVLARIINRSDPASPTGLATSALNAAIQTMADSRITTGDHLVVVDMEAALDYPDDMSDALHPDDGGYFKMAGVWDAAVDALLSDSTPPVVALVGDDPQVVKLGTAYRELGATALDNVDGDISASVVIDASGVDTTTLGSYWVTYDVADSSGNLALRVVRTVEVVDTSSAVVYVSSTSGGNVGGVAFQDEDIVGYDTVADSWSLYLDGSDVGLGGASASDVDAFDVLADGSILLSFVAPTTIPDVGSVDDSDIVRFVPTSLGTATAGAFERYFDGSDVGLTTSGEDVDALTLLADGRIVISTVGSFGVPGISGADEDLVAFTPTSLGAATGGTWERYFDGSDVNLNTASSEDVNGAWIDGLSGDVYLTTVGVFSVTGASGSGADIMVCTPSSLGSSTACGFAMFWDGSAHGWGAEVTDGFHIGG